MTTPKKRVEGLYAQVLARISGDPIEGKKLLDELLFNHTKTAAGRGHENVEVIPGRPPIPWQETADLYAKVEQLRQTKSLSTHDALLEIYAGRDPSQVAGEKSEGLEIKANAWAKTKANQLSLYRQTLVKAAKVIEGSNL